MISIIVAVYNAEKTLKRCIDSILMSTYSDFELLLVDDGSSDSSASILDEYEKKDSRIKVFHKKNGGTSSARNFGLGKAQGEYIGFADNDDYYHPQMLEILVSGFEKRQEIDIVCCKFKKTYEKEKIEYDPISPNEAINWKIFDNEQAVGEYLLAETFSVSVWDKLFKRHLFDNVQFDTHHYYEDKKASYNLIKSAKFVASTNLQLYYYYVHPSSKARTFKLNHLKDFTLITDEVAEDIFIKNPSPDIIKKLKYRIAKDNYTTARTTVNKKEFDISYFISLQRKMKDNSKSYLSSNYPSFSDKIIYVCLSFIPKWVLSCMHK